MVSLFAASEIKSLLNRNASLDILKLLMAFMVVGLHAGFLGEFSALGQYLFVNGIFRLAVPVFLLINGFYFYQAQTKTAQATWLKRVIILYLAWMLFYAYFWFSIPPITLTGISKLIRDIAFGYHHLWYISGMVGAALLLLAIKRLSSMFLVLTALILFLVGVMIQYLGNYHYFDGSELDKIFNMHGSHRNAFLFCYPFFCLGYLINKHKFHNNFNLKLAVFFSVIGLLCLIGESYVNYFQEDRDGGFDNYLSLLIVCPSIFILCSRLNIRGNSKTIALYSTAIYFIHSFVLSVLRKITEFEPTVLTVLGILISAGASYFIIKLNNKIKYIL